MPSGIEVEFDMSEIIFLIVDSPEGGFCARALGESIFTEAESLDELRRTSARRWIATSKTTSGRGSFGFNEKSGNDLSP